jgi:hypothetical protein
MEAEIARKKENINAASNFEKARGWTRSNFKTKNFDPHSQNLDEFLEFSSSDDETKPQNASPLRYRETSPIKKRDRNLGTSQSIKGPFVTDLTKDEEYQFRPSTAIQCRQLQAI